MIWILSLIFELSSRFNQGCIQKRAHSLFKFIMNSKREFNSCSKHRSSSPLIHSCLPSFTQNSYHIQRANFSKFIQVLLKSYTHNFELHHSLTFKYIAKKLITITKVIYTKTHYILEVFITSSKLPSPLHHGHYKKIPSLHPNQNLIP